MEAYISSKYRKLIIARGFHLGGFTTIEKNDDDNDLHLRVGEPIEALIHRVLHPFLNLLKVQHSNVDPTAVVDYLMMCEILFHTYAESQAFRGMCFEQIHYTWPPAMYSTFVNAALTENGFDTIPIDEMPYYFKPDAKNKCIYPVTVNTQGETPTSLAEVVERVFGLQGIRRTQQQQPQSQKASNKRSHMA